MMVLVSRLAGPVLASVLLVGCVGGNFNQPDNQPITVAPTIVELGQQYAPDFGETVIGLSFSGGGMRASAFSYGVIKELAAHKSPSGKIGNSLIDDVVFVSGASAVPGMDAGGCIPETMAGRIERVRRTERVELDLAEHGRGDDQGPAGRGGKPAPTLRIEPNPVPSEVCSPRRTVFQ